MDITPQIVVHHRLRNSRIKAQIACKILIVINKALSLVIIVILLLLQVNVIYKKVIRLKVKEVVAQTIRILMTIIKHLKTDILDKSQFYIPPKAPKASTFCIQRKVTEKS